MRPFGRFTCWRVLFTRSSTPGWGPSLSFPPGLKASEPIVRVLLLIPGDWWRKGDVLGMSEEQAAGRKLFCPCLLRTWLLFFISLAPPPSASLPSLLLSPCSALLDLAVKLICGRKRSTSGLRVSFCRVTNGAVASGAAGLFAANYTSL